MNSINIPLFAAQYVGAHLLLVNFANPIVMPLPFLRLRGFHIEYTGPWLFRFLYKGKGQLYRAMRIWLNRG